MSTEVVKITGNAVTVCTTQGYAYVHDVRNISHIDTRNFEAWVARDTGKQYPAESVIDIWLHKGEEAGVKQFHIVRVKCSDPDEANVIAAELIATLEIYNVYNSQPLDLSFSSAQDNDDWKEVGDECEDEGE